MSRIISPVFCGVEKYYLRFFLYSEKQPGHYFGLFYFLDEKMAMMTEFTKFGRVTIVVKKHPSTLTASDLIIGERVIVENESLIRMCKEEPTEKDETFLILSCDEYTEAYYQ